MTAQIISLRDRAQALGKPHIAAHSTAMRAALQAVRGPETRAEAFRTDQEWADWTAATLLEDGYTGMRDRLRALWESFRESQRIDPVSEQTRGRRLYVLVEIRKLRAGPQPKFRRGQTVKLYGHQFRDGRIERIFWHAPARGQPHFRYIVRVNRDCTIDTSEDNLIEASR